jgi:N-methylhydantoinase B
VGALPWAVASVAEFFKDRIAPGDLFLLNDPYHGNNHLPDLTVLLPVFVGDRPVFWSINRAHQHDIGGATHGAYNPGATEIWQEGIRITPLKLYDRGVLRDDVLQMVATNVRHPRDFQGDLRAMMGSARLGERRLLKLVDDYGLETVLETIGEILDGAERQARACIRGWKDGVFKGEAILDDDGHGIEDVHIRATVTKKGDSLTVDLSDSHDQVIGFVNSAFPNTMSAGATASQIRIDDARSSCASDGRAIMRRLRRPRRASSIRASRSHPAATADRTRCQPRSAVPAPTRSRSPRRPRRVHHRRSRPALR